MASVPATIKSDSARILREMASLSAVELDRLACQLLILRAAKRGQVLPAREADLLMTINRSTPWPSRAAYRRLCAKRRAGTLRPAEHRQLLELTDELEVRNAERAKSLAALAALRRTSVPALMEDLGLESLAHG